MLVKSSLRPPRYVLHSRPFTIQHPSPSPPGQGGRKGGTGRSGRAAKEGGGGGSSSIRITHPPILQATDTSPPQPQVEPQEKPKKPKGRAWKRILYVSFHRAHRSIPFLYSRQRRGRLTRFFSKQVHPPLRKRHHDRWQEEDEPQPRNLSICFLLFWFFSSFQHPSPLPHGGVGVGFVIKNWDLGCIISNNFKKKYKNEIMSSIITCTQYKQTASHFPKIEYDSGRNRGKESMKGD